MEWNFDEFFGGVGDYEDEYAYEEDMENTEVYFRITDKKGNYEDYESNGTVKITPKGLNGKNYTIDTTPIVLTRSVNKKDLKDLINGGEWPDYYGIPAYSWKGAANVATVDGSVLKAEATTGNGFAVIGIPESDNAYGTHKEIRVTVNTNYNGGALTGSYRIVKGDNLLDVSKAKISIVDKNTGKAVKVHYTGQKVGFAGDDQFSQGFLKVTIKNGKQEIVLLENGVGDNQVSDFFDIEYVNNVRRGTAYVLISAKDKDEQPQDKGYNFVGSAKGSFRIGQLGLKELLNLLL